MTKQSRAMPCVFVAGLFLSGCAYNAPVGVSPNLNVYSSYGDKLPGRYALVVESDAFNTDVKPTGYNCSAHHFPLDLREAFAASTAGTLRQLVQDVQVLPRPIPAQELANQGFAGEVIVTAETISARVQVVPGFWSSSASSVVEMSAGMTVDTINGRALGTSAQGFGDAQNDAGAMCGETATAIGTATEKAMRQLLGQLGERLSNSDRLRRASFDGGARQTEPQAVYAAPARAAAPSPAAPTSQPPAQTPPPLPARITSQQVGSAPPQRNCGLRVVGDPDALHCD
jgi:hypothetical protein